MLHARAGALLRFCAGGASDSAMVSTQRKTSRRSASYDSRGVERAHWREEPGSAAAAHCHSRQVAFTPNSSMGMRTRAAGTSTPLPRRCSSRREGETPALLWI